MIYGAIYRNWGPRGGNGYLGGNAPAGEDDGRAKIKNVPGKVYIKIFTMYDVENVVFLASVLSAQDGTWRLEGIDSNVQYRVIGADLAGLVNSAIQDWVTPAKMGD